MYEELVKALREYAYRRCPLEEKAGICGNHDALKAAYAIEELSKRVPSVPHGRLIDADVLMKEMDKQENAIFEHGREFTFSFKSGGDVCTAWYNVEMMIEDAPTIIPAEEGV